MKTGRVSLIVFCLYGLSAHVFSQTAQKGLVVEMNSGNKPVAGVAVMAVGAIPTDSDGNGAFQLVFSKAKPGTPVVITQIYKDGYELVNDTDVKSWTLSGSHQFKIVLCQKGMLDISRRKFYDIGQDRYYTLYLQAQKELKNEKENNKISQKKYEDALSDAMKEYERAMSQLTFYADKFARINKDDLNDLDSRALALMEEGKVEEAIKLYEDAEILKKFTEKVSLRDTASFNINALTEALGKELLLLTEKSDSKSLVKIDSIYTILIQYDSVNYSFNLDYASFLMTSNRMDEAFQCLKRSLLAASDETEEKNVDNLIKQLFIEIKDEQILDSYKNQIEEVYQELREKREIEALKKVLQ